MGFGSNRDATKGIRRANDQDSLGTVSIAVEKLLRYERGTA
jgi:hypothetical protein